MEVDSAAFEFALGQIKDGFIFENFASQFASSILGYDFTPAGGIKDRGIDGLENVFARDKIERHVYQSSIEKDPFSKIKRTIVALNKNSIPFESLTLLTNQVCPNKDTIIDDLFVEHKKSFRIYDLKWFSSRVNSNPGAANAYHTFVDSYLHEFNKPGKAYAVSNLVHDPRLFVFLRQQWEENRRDLNLDKLLADTLILFALEDTDPDQERLKTVAEVKQSIESHIKFDPQLLSDTIDDRLDKLSKSPLKKIQFHPQKGAYCLPYATRLQIQDKNLADAALYETFQTRVSEKLKSYLDASGAIVKDRLSLVEETINRLFYQQGLEFADFVVSGSTKQSFEKNLPEIVSAVVEESAVVQKNHPAVKSALLMTIRDTVYNGTAEEKLFIKRLANTYMMLFMLQCDPKVATFFSSLANKLTVYVCTSIIIPALSEFYLEDHNRRHWNLLKGARRAGVKLLVNQKIVDELVGHFRMIMRVYADEYERNEDFFLSDETLTLYIDEILIRAYFYAKRRNQVLNFRDFIDNFVSPDLFRAETNMADWLKEEFGIQFVSDESLGVQIDKSELKQLTDALAIQKHHPKKASNDAAIILNIFAQRAKSNEITSDSIFGYKTWWLSKDTITQQTVNTVFGTKYNVSCYMRPDFLYNYISLAPTQHEVDAAYSELFPSLLGVNISAHLPPDLVKYIHEKIDEHSQKNPARLKAIMRDLAERLKMDASVQNRKYVNHFLDEQLKPRKRKLDFDGGRK